MSDSEDDLCPCADCYTHDENMDFHDIINDVPQKTPVQQAPGLRRGFLNNVNKARKPSPCVIPTLTPTLNKQIIDKAVKTKPTQTSNDSKKVVPIVEEKVEEMKEVRKSEILKCTKCIERSSEIDTNYYAAFKVICCDGCTLFLHRSCFEKALGSGKKKELKSCLCPTDGCGYEVEEINHREAGYGKEFILWLRCVVEKKIMKEKIEDKKKESIKKKDDIKKDKYKKDDNRNGDEDDEKKIDDNTNDCMISLAPSSLSKHSYNITKKTFTKPLPVDLIAHPLEKTEDAIMNKYTVKEVNTSGNTKHKKKKDRGHVFLPGLTVVGQRGGKEENKEEDEYEYDEDRMRIDEEMNDNDDRYRRMNSNHLSSSSFHHTPFRDNVFIPQPINARNRNDDYYYGDTRNIFNPVPLMDIEIDGRRLNTYDEEYPDRIDNDHYDRMKTNMIHFFKLSENELCQNANQFDESYWYSNDMYRLLDNYIEFTCESNEANGWRRTLRHIMMSNNDDNVIEFMTNLSLFQCGIVNGRLIISLATTPLPTNIQSMKTNESREDSGDERFERWAKEKKIEREDIERRERIEEEKRRKEEEEEMERRKYEEEKKRKEDERRNEEERKRKEDEWRRNEEERKRKEDEWRRNEEERKRKEDEWRRNEEERKRKEDEWRRNEEERKRKEDERKRNEEERKRKEDEWRRNEEERKRKEDERKRNEEERKRKEDEWRRNEEMKKHEEEIRRNEEIKRKEKEKNAMEEERMRIEEESNKRRIDEYYRRNIGYDVPKKELCLDVNRRKRMINEEQLRQTCGIYAYNEDRSQSFTSDNDNGNKYGTSIRREDEGSRLSPLSPSAPPFIPSSQSSSIHSIQSSSFNPNAKSFIPTTNVIDESEYYDEVVNDSSHQWDINAYNDLIHDRGLLDEYRIEIKNMEKEIREKDEKIHHLHEELKELNDKKRKDNVKIEDLSKQIEMENDNYSICENEKDRLNVELERYRSLYEEKIRENEETMNRLREMEVRNRMNMEELNEIKIKKSMDLLEKKIKVSSKAILYCDAISKKIYMHSDGSRLGMVFIQLKDKWIDYHKRAQDISSNYKIYNYIDWYGLDELIEPRIPIDAYELILTSYEYHYGNLHKHSYDLAVNVKFFLLDKGKSYPDAYIHGVIQKWMKTLSDLPSISFDSNDDTLVERVSRMVVIAMGDDIQPLLPPPHSPSPPPPPPSTSSIQSSNRPLPNLSLNMNKQFKRNIPPPTPPTKVWKNHDKVRHVSLMNHECLLCLEVFDEDNDIIFHCESESCNEPYHKQCVDDLCAHSKIGVAQCPNCRRPFPSREEYPRL